MSNSGQTLHPYAMTEAEWLSSSDPNVMLQFLPYAGVDRKFRLFACACAHRILHLRIDDLPRKILEAGEKFADGVGSRDDLLILLKEVNKLGEEQYQSGLTTGYHATFAMAAAAHVGRKESLRPFEAHSSAITASDVARSGLACAAKAGKPLPEGNKRFKEAKLAEQAVQAELLRDVFGNVFHPEAATSSLSLPHPALGLAQEIYEKKSFDHLPHLADLLEETGCANASVTQHLRKPSGHVRGCWALDCVLGKEGIPDVIAMLLDSDDPGERYRGLCILRLSGVAREQDIKILVDIAQDGRFEDLQKEAREALTEISPKALGQE